MPKAVRNQRNKRNQARGALRLYMPPPIASNVMVNHTYRFKGTSPSFTWLQRDIFKMIGVTATAVNVGYYIAASFKINYIKIWATTQSSLSSQITFRWASDGSVGASTLETTDMSLSSAYPAYVVARPVESTYQSMWTTYSTGPTNEWFTIDASTNVVIDINVTYTLSDGTNASNYTIANATPGRIYYQSPNASLTPVGLNQTI